MSSNNGPGAVKRAADSISGFDDPSMGDERERDVTLRAYTFAMQLGVYLSLLFALLLAVVGVGFWSVTLILAAGIASWAAIWYCERENVSMAALVERAGPRRKKLAWILVTFFMLAWLGAMAFHMLTGAPLVPIDASPGNGDSSVSTVVGGFVGALVGLLAAVGAMKYSAKRARRAQAEPEYDEE